MAHDGAADADTDDEVDAVLKVSPSALEHTAVEDNPAEQEKKVLKSFTSQFHCEMTGSIEGAHYKTWTSRHMQNTLSGRPSPYAVQICKR